MNQQENGEEPIPANDPTGHNTLKLMLEINMLFHSIAAIEHDMEQSIRHIRQSAAAFAEPRRQRLHALMLKLIIANCNPQIRESLE
ncbi:MAG: hypothetical protein HQL84_13830 [Magnetococcales bacterium]|nr:hypothetical protein [Magnetococcales bacterium]MBF0151115.1 hypothetical protein [Magnetococcales bacterium]MBF0174033.1 hypothetical protein [Magnetococcales bacterium]MBF0346778.1 hypothetical protein [Magnetococcales bacterium]MBF0630975.1 hypothetical protein [Magnetococcales bacterium]